MPEPSLKPLIDYAMLGFDEASEVVKVAELTKGRRVFRLYIVHDMYRALFAVKCDEMNLDEGIWRSKIDFPWAEVGSPDEALKQAMKVLSESFK